MPHTYLKVGDEEVANLSVAPFVSVGTEGHITQYTSPATYVHTYVHTYIHTYVHVRVASRNRRLAH